MAKGRGGRRARLAPALAAIALVVAAGPAPSQTTLPDVDVTVVVEVSDTVGWQALYGDVLGTPREATKPLGLSVAAGTGVTRSIAVQSPRFQVHLRPGAPRKVVITGKIAGVEALRGVATFEQAVLEMQTHPRPGQITLSHGLHDVAAHLLEMTLVRP